MLAQSYIAFIVDLYHSSGFYSVTSRGFIVLQNCCLCTENQSAKVKMCLNSQKFTTCGAGGCTPPGFCPRNLAGEVGTYDNGFANDAVQVRLCFTIANCMCSSLRVFLAICNRTSLAYTAFKHSHRKCHSLQSGLTSGGQCSFKTNCCILCIYRYMQVM